VDASAAGLYASRQPLQPRRPPIRADFPLTRDLVLIGGGHTHALVLRNWGMAPQPGVRVTLINPGPTAPYSGMLPGYVAGHYDRATLDIDLVRLARFAGARLILGAASGIDLCARTVAVEGRPPVGFDVLSIDIGITSDLPDLPGFSAHGVPAKPLGAFAGRWSAFREAVRVGDMPATVAIIGGGVAGVELALAAAHALRAGGAQPVVHLIERGPHPNGLGPRARAAVMETLGAAGIDCHFTATVARVEAGRVVLADGTALASAFTIGAAGAVPQGWLRETGLALTDGFIEVGADLSTPGDPSVFAAGDCAHLTASPRPKAGVYAVRAAPVLAHNLRAALSGGSRHAFRPQRRYLKLISLGGKSALAERGGLALSGPWLWRLKDRIDRHFMRRFDDLPRLQPPPPPKDAALGLADLVADKPLCGGCGAKVGGGVLRSALAALPAPRRDDILTGVGDDAAVLAIGSARQVLTTDHLRAFTEDPVAMTRIAALHALGDVWAMGARPQAALVSVTLPRMSPALLARSLAEIMQTAAATFAEAGAAVVGGHSTMGAEMVLGFTVTGLVDRPAIGQDGARPGDALILTRAIGSGVILAAEMAGAARGEDVAALLARMQVAQGDAAAILGAAHAMTDVTGFGLAGHLMAICRASGCGADLDAGAVPLCAGALDLAGRGHRSALLAANQADAPLDPGRQAGSPLVDLLHDPQTAGGFLAAIPAAEAGALLSLLRAAGHDAARIGTVTEGPPGIRLI
jgi:selenide,water dikinase